MTSKTHSKAMLKRSTSARRDRVLSRRSQFPRNSSLVTRLILRILRPSMFAPSITGRVGVNAQRRHAHQRFHWLLQRERSRALRRAVVPRLRDEGGFTLIELLVVVGIIALLFVLIAPAFTYMKSGSDFTNGVYGIQGVLENARTYAKANHTYVFVGFAEVDASADPSASPQNAGNGRVAVAVVASKDGTGQFNYATSGQGADWTLNYNNGANLIAVGKLQRYENLHFLVNFGSWPFSADHPNMGRSQPGTFYTLGIAPSSVTPFAWPLGSPQNSGQYQFNKVIYFDPRGIARIAYSTNANEIVQVMEIDLQPTHGTLVPPNPSNQEVGNQAAIQVAPMSGEVRVYRP